MKPLCGPKLSLCCMLLSIWGVIQLSGLGVFYYIGALNLLEDVAENVKEVEDLNAEKALHLLDHYYKAAAINCWIASGVYFFFFLFSMSQFALRGRLHKNKNE